MRREREVVEQNNSVQPGLDVKRWLTFDKMDGEISEDILEKSEIVELPILEMIKKPCHARRSGGLRKGVSADACMFHARRRSITSQVRPGLYKIRIHKPLRIYCLMKRELLISEYRVASAHNPCREPGSASCHPNRIVPHSNDSTPEMGVAGNVPQSVA